MYKYYFLILFCLFSRADAETSKKILFAGDTHFGDNYQLKIESRGGINVIKKYGYDYFFVNVKDLFVGSFYAVVNLETPLIESFSTGQNNYKYSHFSDIDSVPYYLSKYQIKAASIANNHILDEGYAGLYNTISALNSYGITPFGSGSNSKQASNYLLITEDNVISPVYIITGYWKSRFGKRNHVYAEGDKGGVSMLDPSKAAFLIKQIKETAPGAFIILYPHWGRNYQIKSRYQSELAHSLIDSGADLIIGHGAHTIQEVEYYKGKWIIYNIGNFIFNAPGRYESTGAKPYGLIAELILDNTTKTLRLIPIYTDNIMTDYQIRYLSEDEFDDCYSLAVKGKVEKTKIIRKDFSYLEIPLD